MMHRAHNLWIAVLHFTCAKRTTQTLAILTSCFASVRRKLRWICAIYQFNLNSLPAAVTAVATVAASQPTHVYDAFPVARMLHVSRALMPNIDFPLNGNDIDLKKENAEQSISSAPCNLKFIYQNKINEYKWLIAVYFYYNFRSQSLIQFDHDLFCHIA